MVPANPDIRARSGAGTPGRWYILNIICTGLAGVIYRRITSGQIAAA
jgi:hypothetical protein